jgi:hypothetical protein
MKQTYTTCDGQTFDDEDLAQLHEDTLFDDWLAKPATQRLTVQDLLGGLSTRVEGVGNSPRTDFLQVLGRCFLALQSDPEYRADFPKPDGGYCV